MARRRYLLTYDISDDARWRQVHEAARRFGYRLQYSVFICDLDAMERTKLLWDLGDAIDHHVDKIALIDLGDAYRVDRITFLGVRPTMPSHGPTIV